MMVKLVFIIKFSYRSKMKSIEPMMFSSSLLRSQNCNYNMLKNLFQPSAGRVSIEFEIHTFKTRTYFYMSFKLEFNPFRVRSFELSNQELTCPSGFTYFITQFTMFVKEKEYCFYKNKFINIFYLFLYRFLLSSELSIKSLTKLHNFYRISLKFVKSVDSLFYCFFDIILFS